MPRLTTPDIARCALFAALIAGGAFVTVPLGPVPLTLQVFFVLVAGMMLGPRLATLSVAAYLTLGLVMPVYAGGGAGMGALLGPTGGFLMGFVPAVLVVGWLSNRKAPTMIRLLTAGLAGLLPVYALGAAWLAFQFDLGVGAAITSGVLPFLPVDVAKVGLAAAVARSLVSSPQGLLAPLRDH